MIKLAIPHKKLDCVRVKANDGVCVMRLRESVWFRASSCQVLL